MILEFEMNQLSTSDEVNKKIDLWKNKKWGVQLTAMKYLAEYKEARKFLKDAIIYEEVYLALLKRAISL